MKELFLDANAHVPMSTRTMLAYETFNSSVAGYGHPLSPAFPGRKAAQILEMSREKIAELIGAESSNQIFFTNGCSEACDWGIKILAEIDKKKSLANGVYDILSVSPIEHPAVSLAVDKVTDKCSGQHLNILDIKQMIEVGENGIIKTDKYQEKENYPGKTVCIKVQNEIGTVQPIEKLNAGYLFSDMSQALGKLPVRVVPKKSLYFNKSRFEGVDIAAFSAHKFGGPSGIGFMYLKNTDHWIEYGNGSRYELDIPGTPNVAAIATAAVALEEALTTLHYRFDNCTSFRKVLEEGLKNLGFKIIGDKKMRIPNTSFVQVPDGQDSTNLLLELGKEGIYCGLGSACGSLHEESGLMKVLSKDSSISKYLRISQWGYYDKKDAEYFLSKLRKIL